MALRLAGEVEGGVVQEVVEEITYSPGLQTSNDLEAATRTITATAEASGVGNADYSAALTLSAPSDARLAVKRIAARLAVTIDSMTAASVRCRVYVDSQVAGNLLFDETWTSAGAKLAAVDTHSGNLASIFNLLKDGAAHTFYLFFWVNAGNAVLSLAQVWEAMGTSQASAAAIAVLSLAHRGLLGGILRLNRVGSGSPVFRLCFPATYWHLASTAGAGAEVEFPSVVACDPDFVLWGTVATDICYHEVLYLSLGRQI